MALIGSLSFGPHSTASPALGRTVTEWLADSRARRRTEFTGLFLGISVKRRRFGKAGEKKLWLDDRGNPVAAKGSRRIVGRGL